MMDQTKEDALLTPFPTLRRAAATRHDPGVLARLAGAVLRNYIAHSPVARGKGLVCRRIAPRLPVQAREFVARFPGDTVVILRFDEWLGRHYLQHGSFEPAELAWALSQLPESGVMFDGGANVGVYTVTAARKVGGAGRVIAIEADSAYAPRLTGNVELNGLHNVTSMTAAAGKTDGEAVLIVASEGAFSSTDALQTGSASGESRRVRQVKLDSVWQEAGEPPVSLAKIDVEGAELGVLHGAERLLERCRPALLVEVQPGTAEAVQAHLRERGYTDVTPAAFSGVNRAFVAS
jgi:FkbM family methyltransferase